MIDGKQFTIVWHVNDLKISHMDGKEVDEFIKQSQNEFEDEVGEVKVSRGKTHDFLGMILDFSSPGKVKVNVVQCIKKMIEDFPEDTNTTAITPAAFHLFLVRDDGDKLPEDKAVSFHDIWLLRTRTVPGSCGLAHSPSAGWVGS